MDNDEMNIKRIEVDSEKGNDEVSEAKVAQEAIELIQEEKASEEEATTLASQNQVSKPWLNYYDSQIPHTLDYPDINIAQFLIDSATHYPKHKAIYFMGKIYTYEEVYKSADNLARHLGRLGVHKGDRVAIMLPNCPQAIIAYYAVLLAGAVVVQTNPLYVERELKYQLSDCGAVALITVDLLYERVANVRGKDFELGALPKLKNVIITSISDGLPFPKNKLYAMKQNKKLQDIPYGMNGYIKWSTVIKKAGIYERPTLAKGNELAAIQYTGGTTGTPKGAMLSHRNLVANTMQTSHWCYKAEKGKEIYLAALPLFHVFGLTVLMNYAVSQAGLLVLVPKFEVDIVLKTIHKTKPTIFPGAPTMYIGLIQAAQKQKRTVDLSSINVCISGSAALPLEVQEQFEKLTGGRLIEGYGLSEASPVTHANPIWGARKIGSIGLPFPDTEAAIIDPNTERFLPPNELGELVVRGPQVMLGYWNQSNASQSTLKNGWLRTGDLAKMDHDGYFTIMDRIKDLIIAGGFNIYPREIEEVLYEHPAIAEAAVIGIKDNYRGETVKAYIVLKEGYSTSEEELNRYCREKLATYKVPQYYEFINSFPKTMVGKILKRKLIELNQNQD